MVKINHNEEEGKIFKLLRRDVHLADKSRDLTRSEKKEVYSFGDSSSQFTMKTALNKRTKDNFMSMD